MSSLSPRRNVAASERGQRPCTNVAWMLVRVVGLAMLAGAWSGLCWAEDRPVIENSIGMKLVLIPSGEFLMGGKEEQVARCLASAKTLIEHSSEGGR